MSLYYPSGDSKINRQCWYILSALLVLVCMAALLKFGLMGVMALCLLISMAVITPLLMERYKFYLFVWLFISPAFDNFRAFLVAGTNPVVFLITGLTLPFAAILVLRDFRKVTLDVPFVTHLALFNLLLVLNLFRPDAEPGVLLECLKVFIELFVVFCAHHEMKAGNSKMIFNGINVFIIVNSLVAVFQRITGIGMALIEGLPRVGGLVGHPNCLAFVNVLYIPFGIYKVVNATDPKEKNFWLTGVIISVMVLLLTLCKSVILAFALQAAVLFLFLPNKLKIRVVVSVVLALAVFLAANFAFNLHFLDQFSNRFSNNSSLIWRLKIWGYLLGSVEGPSLIIGHGVNAAKGLIAMIDSRGSSHVHNAYLQLLYDYGLTGLLYLLAFIHPFIRFSGFFFAAPPQERLNKTIPLLILLAIFMNMASDNSVFLRTPMVFAWLFLVELYLNSKPAAQKTGLPEKS